MGFQHRTTTLAASARIGLLAAVALCMPYVAHAQETSPQHHAISCESLVSLPLPNATITGAESIPAGTFQPPGSPTAITDLPAFCRVTATLTPVPDSSIGIEVWLPTDTWNGNYQQSGNHGFGGALHWGEMVPQLQRGYATAVTDDGHVASEPFDVSWAFGHPETITDLAWRGVHETAVNAKLLIAGFYGRPPTYAYFNGCSDGGREGMKSAQMFPSDFDGIIAGAAAADWTHAATEQLFMSESLQKAGISAANLTLAQNAATATCDAADGAADGLIENPMQCRWNPYALLCKAGQSSSSCITPAQAAAIKGNVDTLSDPITGDYVFSGMARGSEFDQIRWAYQVDPAPFGIANYRIALNDPNWDGSQFDLHTQLPLLDQALGSLNATDPDLRSFQRRGGKLIEWQGWDDAAFTPGWTTKYYDQVVEKTGQLEDVQSFYRLFMLPGVGHCGTANDIGPNNIGAENQIPVNHDPQHDVVSALEAWVEHGTAPEQLIATQFNNNDPTKGIRRQRPICSYPAQAVYKGLGDMNDASNFVCTAPDG